MTDLILPPDVVRLPAPAGDDEILAVVRRWVAVLAAEDYERAYGMTAHEAQFGWTPRLMKDVIEGYCGADQDPEEPSRVSPLETAKGGPPPRHEVDYAPSGKPNGAIGDVWFDLPISGEWSDLTATFSIHRVGKDVVLSLNEIHVF